MEKRLQLWSPVWGWPVSYTHLDHGKNSNIKLKSKPNCQRAGRKSIVSVRCSYVKDVYKRQRKRIVN